MERLFFTINELTARAAKEANSMSGYVAGSATSEYQNMVNRVYDTVEKIKEKKPNLAEKAQHMAERYSRKLAETAHSKCQIRIKQSYQRAGKTGGNGIGGISHGRAFDKANCI